MIRREQLPFAAATVVSFTMRARFSGNMERALELADGTVSRSAASRAARGMLRGIGICNYVEAPVGNLHESVIVHVLPAGRVEVEIGTQSSGQGHETTFAQVPGGFARRLDRPHRDHHRQHAPARARRAVIPTARCAWAVRFSSRPARKSASAPRAEAGSDDYDLFEIAASGGFACEGEHRHAHPRLPDRLGGV